MREKTEYTPQEAIADGRLLEEFFDDLTYRKRVSPRTVESYKLDLKRFTAFLAEECRTGVTRCTRDDILAFLVDCESRGNSPRTRSRRLSTLKSFFTFLKRRGRIDKIPTSGLKGARIPGALPEILTGEEMEKLLSEGRSGDKYRRRTGIIVELMYSTGLRVSETIKLKMEHLLAEENIIRIESGKGGKGRLVIVPDVTLGHLEEYIEDVHSLILEGGYSSWLFPSRSGKAISRQAVWRNIKLLGKEAGIGTNLHPHVLRHTCATHLIENGCDLVTVQLLLGHADISTTEIYTHIVEGRKRKVFRTAHPRA